MATLVSPWINYFHEVEELFRYDEDVAVKFDDDSCTLKLYVDDQKKAEAIEYILPKEKVFGNVTMKISVIPSNKELSDPMEALRIAFKGNRIFNGTQVSPSPFGDVKFAIFSPDSVQYYNDNMYSLCGMKTTIYEDIAKDVLDVPSDVHITSDCWNRPDPSFHGYRAWRCN